MNKNLRSIIAIVCTLCCVASVQAATVYWDINGATPGAGGSAPSGTWSVATNANWTTNSTGASTNTIFNTGDDVVFSAGTDATGSFTVNVSDSTILGNLTIEEGNVTLWSSNSFNVGNGTDGKGIINVLGNASLTINGFMTGANTAGMLSLAGSNTLQNTISGIISNYGSFTKVEKREAGTWALLGSNTFSGVCDVRQGTLIINSVADAGFPSSVGTGGVGGAHTWIGLGASTSTNTTLKYIGSGHSTTRRVQLWGNPTGGGVIDASGTGPLLLQDVNRPPADVLDKTLFLTGSNSDTNTIRGVIYDSTGGYKTHIVKEGVGKWVLTGPNSYTGATTVNGGTLLVNIPGSLAYGSAVTVNSGGTFGGSGTVVGPVTVAAGGVLSPGESVGTLMLNNDLVLGGNLFLEVNKSLTPSEDFINVVGVLTNTGTGTVTIANLGPTLVAGDSFQFFSKAVLNGAALTVLSTGGVVWTNKLALDGSIGVVSVSPIPPPSPATNLTIAAVGPTSINLGGKGAANSTYNVYAHTNVAAPMANWWPLGSTNSSAGGVIQFLDAQATNGQRFYRFGQPSP